ncbi:MAG: MBL fold metallo-hydrolase [Methanobacteriaceae archaeon]|nr:MBL fold metallo-hydrolase [Methanobacteriaceae archaeon]
MEIIEKVHAIKMPFQIKTGKGLILDRFVYVYLIYGEEIYLIDSGVASSRKIICDYLEKSGRSCDELALIIHTHAHPDHIGSTKSLQEISNSATAIHQTETSWLEDTESQLLERPVPGFRQLVEGSVNVDIALEDHDAIELEENIHLEVIHTPGHSPGSISLFIPDEKILFSGDAIPLAGDIPIYDDYQDSVNSLKKLKDLKNVDMILSSWDDPKTFDEAQESINDSIEYLEYIHQ